MAHPEISDLLEDLQRATVLRLIGYVRELDEPDDEGKVAEPNPKILDVIARMLKDNGIVCSGTARRGLRALADEDTDVPFPIAIGEE